MVIASTRLRGLTKLLSRAADLVGYEIYPQILTSE